HAAARGRTDGIAGMTRFTTLFPGSAWEQTGLEAPPPNNASTTGDVSDLQAEPGNEVTEGIAGMTEPAEKQDDEMELLVAAALDPRQLERFRLEAQAAAQLHHSNIVPVYSVGCERGVYYYAMQYIEGRSLAEVIAELAEHSANGVAATKIAATEPVGPVGPT